VKTFSVLILALGLSLYPQAVLSADEAEAAEDGETAAEEAGSAPTESVEAVAETEADEAVAVTETDEAVEDADAEAAEEAAEAVAAGSDEAETAEAEVTETVAAEAPAMTEPVADEAGAETAPVAAPIAEEAVEAVAEVAAEVAGDEDAGDDEAAGKPGRPWSLTAGHNFGFGLQIDEATHYYYGQLSVSGSYRIHGALSARASAGLHYTPNPRPRDARRLDVGGVSFGVAHGNLFHEDTFTDIRVSGSATVALPLSMGGRAMGNYPTIGAGVSFSRSVGPVNFSYGLNFNKFNPKSQVRYLPLCAEDRGDISYCIGSYETNWQLGHRVGASYTTPVDGLSLSASFGTTLTRTYGPSRHDPAMSPEYMHHVRANVRDGFGFGLSAGYRLPVDGLSASLSLSNGGSWRSNGQDLYNPLFDPRLAAMSVGVSYTY
jgi:hypothetical protein